MSPADRKRSEQSSSVFDSPCCSRPSSVMSVVDAKPFERTSLYIEDSPVKTRYKSIGKKLQSQTQDWREAATETRPKTTKAFNPKDHRDKQLRSQLDSHGFSSSQTPTASRSKEPVYRIDPKSMKQYNLTRVEQSPQRAEASLVTIEVSGLDRNCTDEYLKGVCRGFHMVTVNTNVNRITGDCTGKATLQARVVDTQTAKKLSTKLTQKGFKVQEAAPVAGRSTNYFDCKVSSFLDPHTEIAQRRLTSKFSDARSSTKLSREASYMRRISQTPSDDSFKELQKWEQTRRTPTSRPSSIKRR